MKLICLIKYVPDVDNFKYDYENNVLIRENVRLLLNPDDACAVAFALKVKARHPDIFIETVTMAPTSVKPHVEDLLRTGVDKATIISDRAYAGSDTYATSMILSEYLSDIQYDVILTGTHAIDGDTSHIPSQIGSRLNINQISGIVKIDEERFSRSSVVFDVETESAVSTYEMKLPAILSLTRDSKYKLPYVSRKDMERDISQELNIINNDHLHLHADGIGLKGSLTKVVKTYTREFDNRNRKIVKIDDEGIEEVYKFLKDKGFV